MTKFLQIMALASVVLASSCGKKDDPEPDPTPATNVSKAMFMNACISSQPLAVRLNNTAIPSFTPLNYLESSGYLDLVPATGVTTTFVFASSNVKLVETTQDYNLNTHYSVFATGIVNDPSVLVTTDDLSAPAANVAKVRFINLSPDDLNETVFVGSTKIDSNVTTNEATAFASVAAGSYKVIVQDPANVPASQDIAAQQFDAGKIYTILLVGTQGGSDEAALRLKVISHN